MESLLEIGLVGAAAYGIVWLIRYGFRAPSGDESGSHDSNELNSTDQDGRNSVQREKAICSDCRDRIATYINPPLCSTCRARRSPNWFSAVKKPVTKKKGEQGDELEPQGWIPCEGCGDKVSKRLTVCPHCGCPIEPKVICPDCGENFVASLAACPACGGPAPDSSG